MAEVKWTLQALEDIEDIAYYIEHHSPKYAKIQTQRFFDKAKELEINLLSGRIVPELQDPSLRELILGNYRIKFKTEEKPVIILTIHHASRKLEGNRKL